MLFKYVSRTYGYFSGGFQYVKNGACHVIGIFHLIINLVMIDGAITVILYPYVFKIIFFQLNPNEFKSIASTYRFPANEFKSFHKSTCRIIMFVTSCINRQQLQPVEYRQTSKKRNTKT